MSIEAMSDLVIAAYRKRPPTRLPWIVRIGVKAAIGPQSTRHNLPDTST